MLRMGYITGLLIFSFPFPEGMKAEEQLVKYAAVCYDDFGKVRKVRNIEE